MGGTPVFGRSTRLPTLNWAPIAPDATGEVTLQSGESTLTFKRHVIAAGTNGAGILQIRVRDEASLIIEVARHGSSPPEAISVPFGLQPGTWQKQ